MTTIISGTNRLGSNTLKLAKYYQRQLKGKGIDANLFSLTNLPDNLIKTDMYGKRSDEFLPIQQLISNTQKFIFVIPEYNGSFPGVLKVFIDCCKFPDSFYGKKAILVGLSDGKYGNIRGIEHFTGICHYIGLHVLPLRIHLPAIKQELDKDDNIFKEDTLKFTNQQIGQIIAF